MCLLRLLSPVLCLPFLAACGGEHAPAVADPAADSAFALLASLDPRAVDEAYRRLDRYAYTVTVRLTAEDAGGRREARCTLAGRPGAGTRVVSSEGEEAFGGHPCGERILNPLPRLLPDEPAFLAPRSREQYRYLARTRARRVDTLGGSWQLRVVEARLWPGAFEEQPIRRARFLVDAATGRLLGVEVERASTAALFDEGGRVTVHLQPGPDGALVPARALAETRVNVPGAPLRRLRLEQRFHAVTADV